MAPYEHPSLSSSSNATPCYCRMPLKTMKILKTPFVTTEINQNDMRTGFDIRTDVVLEHCCHCYDNLGLITLSWTKDTRSCSSQGQSDYLRSSFSTKKEYSNLSSKIQKVDCNTNSAMVFNLGSLRPVTRTLLVSCTSPGVNL